MTRQLQPVLPAERPIGYVLRSADRPDRADQRHDAASGTPVDLTGTLVFNASTRIDSDFDGLPDDVELAIEQTRTSATPMAMHRRFCGDSPGLDPNVAAFPTVSSHRCHSRVRQKM